MKRSNIVLLIVFLVLLIDQVLKIWIKTHMELGDELFPLGRDNPWFRIHFTENPGMAFGLKLGGSYGKLALSLFRIFAVSFMGYYLYKLLKTNAHNGLIYSIALILAGALGNIFDSVFYGVIFDESYHKVATMFPPDGGYAGFLHGKVVDMFYFPLYQGFLPKWIPFMGEKYVEFFRPVFNVADSAITVGVLMIILFQRKYFKEEPIPLDQLNQQNAAAEDTTLVENTTTSSDVAEDAEEKNEGDSIDKT